MNLRTTCACALGGSEKVGTGGSISVGVEAMFELPSLEGVEEVVISREVVEGTAQPLYIYTARAGNAGASAS